MVKVLFILSVMVAMINAQQFIGAGVIYLDTTLNDENCLVITETRDLTIVEDITPKLDFNEMTYLMKLIDNKKIFKAYEFLGLMKKKYHVSECATEFKTICM